MSEVMKSPLRDVFDHQQLITDVSGSGNNWWVFQFSIIIVILQCFNDWLTGRVSRLSKFLLQQFPKVHFIALLPS